MLSKGIKSVISLVAIVFFSTCIDPYSPKLAGYESLLVVDGLITDANSSCTVKLTRTFSDQTDTPLAVPDANVYITDDSGDSSSLTYFNDGKYKTDSTKFSGSIGRKYTLHILTKDGEEYESTPCMMYSVPDIDSVYYEKDQETVANGTKTQNGIRIYLDSKAGDYNQYCRWEYSETWKFKVPTPKKYNYINDSTIPAVDKVNEYCWKNSNSNEIIISSTSSGQVVKQPVYFIASDQSDRLLIQYSILVKQYSVSQNEYDFWNNLKAINETGDDIFAKQPYSVFSNIHNIKNSNERVLGYFQVSAVKERRKYITNGEIGSLGLPFYHYTCKRIEMSPEEYPHSTMDGPITWDELNKIYVASGYYFCEPMYVAGTLDELKELVFALPECADCELTGSSSKPDFWIDLN